MSLASLAGYASSEESEDETNGNQSSGAVPVQGSSTGGVASTLSGVDSIVDEDDDDFLVAPTPVDVPGPSLPLFSSLPAPERPGLSKDATEELVDDVIEPSIPKPTKRQIHIPKLSELEAEDDEGPKAKRPVVKSSAGSSLLKMLPPPASVPVAKGSVTKLTQLTPHSLGKKPPPPKPKPQPIPKKVSAAPAAAAADEDDNDEEPSNFFSFEEPKLSDEQLKNLISAEDLKPREKRPPSPDVGPAVVVAVPEAELEPEPLPAVSASAQEIPEEALVQLRGRRREKVEIFSIDAADFTAEARANLAKNLTVEDTRPAPSEGPELSRLHKSKHHITHLAFQAKARENELKNQWATNRMTKRETQKKYGF